MNLQPPQPPTAPAPAERPTPPTPPRIDKTPFAKDTAEEISEVDDAPQLNRKIETPETMARDAVANGAGSLTKRTVERGDDNQSAARRESSLPAQPADTQSDYDRGQDVLREFKELDAREAQSDYAPYATPAQTSSEQPSTPHVVKLNYHEGHGGVYWIFTIIFVAVAAFVVVKKFLITDKPTLTKAQLFEDSTDRLKAVEEKIKPVKLPPKKDENKGKHFEVRV